MRRDRGRAVRRGIAPQTLRRAMDACLDPADPEHANLRAALSLALQGLLRGAEFAVDGKAWNAKLDSSKVDAKAIAETLKVVSASLNDAIKVGAMVRRCPWRTGWDRIQSIAAMSHKESWGMADILELLAGEPRVLHWRQLGGEPHKRCRVSKAGVCL